MIPAFLREAYGSPPGLDCRSLAHNLPGAQQMIMASVVTSVCFILKTQLNAAKTLDLLMWIRHVLMEDGRSSPTDCCDLVVFDFV